MAWGDLELCHLGTVARAGVVLPEPLVGVHQAAAGLEGEQTHIEKRSGGGERFIDVRLRGVGVGVVRVAFAADGIDGIWQVVRWIKHKKSLLLLEVPGGERICSFANNVDH